MTLLIQFYVNDFITADGEHVSVTVSQFIIILGTLRGLQSGISGALFTERCYR